MKSPIDVAINLGRFYGRALDRPVVYTQGVALSGRLRLDALVNKSPGKTAQEITVLVEPYVAIEPEEIGARVFTTSDGTTQARQSMQSNAIILDTLDQHWTTEIN